MRARLPLHVLRRRVRSAHVELHPRGRERVRRREERRREGQVAHVTHALEHRDLEVGLAGRGEDVGGLLGERDGGVVVVGGAGEVEQRGGGAVQGDDLR